MSVCICSPVCAAGWWVTCLPPVSWYGFYVAFDSRNWIHSIWDRDSDQQHMLAMYYFQTVRHLSESIFWLFHCQSICMIVLLKATSMILWYDISQSSINPMYNISQGEYGCSQSMVFKCKLTTIGTHMCQHKPVIRRNTSGYEAWHWFWL